jgi:hypothetical protein
MTFLSTASPEVSDQVKLQLAVGMNVFPDLCVGVIPGAVHSRVQILVERTQEVGEVLIVPADRFPSW